MGCTRQNTELLGSVNTLITRNNIFDGKRFCNITRTRCRQPRQSRIDSSRRSTRGTQALVLANVFDILSAQTVAALPAAEALATA